MKPIHLHKFENNTKNNKEFVFREFSTFLQLLKPKFEF